MANVFGIGSSMGENVRVIVQVVHVYMLHAD
jgi:hypothetical protein